LQSVESRRDRGPPRDGEPAPASGAGGTPARREGFGRAGFREWVVLGGAILHTGHYDTRPEAHLRDLDVDQPRRTPVALESVLRVRGVEALDAPLKECADARPLR